MSLVKVKKPVPINYVNDVAEKIQRRRYQMLVHSLLYYELGTSIISDATWSTWAKELVVLQREHKNIARQVIFYKEFENFDGNTGMDLPYRDERIIKIAKRLLEHQSTQDSEDAAKRLASIRKY